MKRILTLKKLESIVDFIALTSMVYFVLDIVNTDTIAVSTYFIGGCITVYGVFKFIRHCNAAQELP